MSGQRLVVPALGPRDPAPPPPGAGSRSARPSRRSWPRSARRAGPRCRARSSWALRRRRRCARRRGRARTTMMDSACGKRVPGEVRRGRSASCRRVRPLPPLERVARGDGGEGEGAGEVVDVRASRAAGPRPRAPAPRGPGRAAGSRTSCSRRRAALRRSRAPAGSCRRERRPAAAWAEARFVSIDSCQLADAGEDVRRHVQRVRRGRGDAPRSAGRRAGPWPRSAGSRSCGSGSGPRRDGRAARRRPSRGSPAALSWLA